MSDLVTIPNPNPHALPALPFAVTFGRGSVLRFATEADAWAAREMLMGEGHPDARVVGAPTRGYCGLTAAALESLLIDE